MQPLQHPSRKKKNVFHMNYHQTQRHLCLFINAGQTLFYTKIQKYVMAFVYKFMCTQSRLYNFSFRCNGLSVRSNQARTIFKRLKKR